MIEFRTGCKVIMKKNEIYEDVKYRFPNLTTEEFKEICKNGGLGMYGDIYGNKITSLLICTWINKYIEEKNGKQLNIEQNTKLNYIVKR